MLCIVINIKQRDFAYSKFFIWFSLLDVLTFQYWIQFFYTTYKLKLYKVLQFKTTQRKARVKIDETIKYDRFEIKFSKTVFIFTNYKLCVKTWKTGLQRLIPLTICFVAHSEVYLLIWFKTILNNQLVLDSSSLQRQYIDYS